MCVCLLVSHASHICNIACVRLTYCERMLHITDAFSMPSAQWIL